MWKQRWVLSTNCPFFCVNNLVSNWLLIFYFPHQFEAKLTKHQNRKGIESFTKGQNAEKLGAADSTFKKIPGYPNTRLEVLPQINSFCNLQSPCLEVQYEDIIFRYQIGFNFHTILPEHQRVVDTSISWENNEIFECEPPLFTDDVLSKGNQRMMILPRRKDQALVLDLKPRQYLHILVLKLTTLLAIYMRSWPLLKELH